VRAAIVGFESGGICLRRGLRERLTLSYREVLTAERLPSGRGLRLHTRTSDPVRVRCRGAGRLALENELRRRGVRIVDEYGAMITPTLKDFEAELALSPDGLRQSSDNA
jgi:hypothetical protein